MTRTRTAAQLSVFCLAAVCILPLRPPEVPVQAPRRAVCFAPGTSAEYIAQVEARSGTAKTAPFTASDFQRWSFTATDGFKSAQGSPITLTWSIVPDGTNVPGDFGATSGPSDLRAYLDSIYGNEAAWMAVFQRMFDRWGELCGVTYVHETNDDRATLGTSSGRLGVRADVRIGGVAIDGGFGILAYNGFPNDGDMVIDTSDTFFRSTSQNSRRLRNVLAHEHGHGLALDHVCPQTRTKLMEPTANTAFDGPQYDDILGAQRLYGDRFEPNENAGSGAELLVLDGSKRLTVAIVSIDDDSDTDMFAFDAPEGAYADVTVKPVGTTYRNGKQQNDGSCGTTTDFDSKRQSDLRLALLTSDGDVIQSVNEVGVGETEDLFDVPLTQGADRYYLRVRNSGENVAQMYELTLKVVQRGEKPVAVNDTASTFEVLPVDAAVLDNDSGLADAPIIVTVLTQPTTGKVKRVDDRLIYVPARGFVGEDMFTYGVTDVHGQVATAAASVQVVASARAGDARTDTDGDDFPDELEQAEGTLINDGGSKPGAALDGSGTPFVVKKWTLVLKPQLPSSDKLSVRFFLPVAEGYEPDTDRVAVSVGGLYRSFVLDARGRSTEDGDDSLRLRVKRKQGTVRAGDVRCDLKIKLSDLAEAFADEALDTSREQKAEPRAVTVFVLFDGVAYEATLPLTHTAKTDKKGKTKLFK